MYLGALVKTCGSQNACPLLIWDQAPEGATLFTELRPHSKPAAFRSSALPLRTAVWLLVLGASEGSGLRAGATH